MSAGTALITGVTGFLGRYTARHFVKEGWTVFGTGTRTPENAPQELLSGYEPLVMPSPAVEAMLARVKPDVCVHCAGRASVALSLEDPEADFRTGVVATFELLNALRRQAPACRFIFVSSAAVYGNPVVLPVGESARLSPISPYGFHKALSEALCAEFFKVYRQPAAIARIFSAYGPGLRRQVVWDICRKVLSGGEVKLRGTGRESRDFIHGQDIARAFYLIATAGRCESEQYNVACGVETSISELAQLVLRQAGREARIEFDGHASAGDPLNWRADITRLAALGFRPQVALEDGVAQMVHWVREQFGAGL